MSERKKRGRPPLGEDMTRLQIRVPVPHKKMLDEIVAKKGSVSLSKWVRDNIERDYENLRGLERLSFEDFREEIRGQTIHVVTDTQNIRGYCLHLETELGDNFEIHSSSGLSFRIRVK